MTMIAPITVTFFFILGLTVFFPCSNWAPMWKCQINSADDMRHWAALLPEACVIAIDGPLGAGKTVFAQGLGEGLGIESAIVSPTFTIANQYPSATPFLHIDLYRLEAHELYQLGLDEEIEMWEGMVLIEWASKHPTVLPIDYIHIQLQIDPEQPTIRQATLLAHGNTNQILSHWKQLWTAASASS